MNKRFDFLQMLKDGHRECSESQHDGLTKEWRDFINAICEFYYE